jgi:hypothetical protein
MTKAIADYLGVEVVHREKQVARLACAGEKALRLLGAQRAL